MTIAEFICALHTHKIVLFMDGNEFRDDNLDCPLIALFNAGVDHCSERFDNSDAEDAGRGFGLDGEDIEDIVGISDGEEPNEFAHHTDASMKVDDDARLIRRQEILNAFSSIVEQHYQESQHES